MGHLGARNVADQQRRATDLLPGAALVLDFARLPGNKSRAIGVGTAPCAVPIRWRTVWCWDTGVAQNKMPANGMTNLGEDAMKALLGLSRRIDGMTETIGKFMAWAILAAIVISAGNAIVRKVFDNSSNAWLEIQWWLFGLAFLMCAPWTLSSNEHIRIDIVNNVMPRWMKQAVEVVGHGLFLLPVAAIMVVTSIPFFWTSFKQNEGSGNFGGLIQWPAKLLLPIAFALLFVQGVSELIKRIGIITGHMTETASGGGHHAAAEAEAKRLQEALEEEALKRGA
jgi:TRAP-type mannitol/chloroaromatic compound transport system permease small subunit